ncbi:restriction endonuclease subunit S [Campylobacter taeniopygiae]|uniref:DNA methylase n=1 Tax=Campylobacter taeniopygiae TaxID=2510188 RepID=A0ABY2TKP6_9BACT|nr:restriction endonuclease subunit S [Campylobacter taeniopygiae]TKX34422.1 DNA methylase [Campylobacter taeniopygiae]
MSLNQNLQEKYPHLELSVLKLSEVKKDNESFRIDSEPFKKSNLYFNKNILYEKLSNIATINPSKNEISNLSQDTIVTFLSMQNLGNGFINYRESGQIVEFKNGYTYFMENDILIAKITPCMEHGKCAIATGLTNGIGFGSTEFNVFRIQDSRFLTAFVFCYLDRDSIRKTAADNMIGTSGRQRVPTAFYEKLIIPILPMSFQQEIEKMVKDSYKALEESKALYKKAEETLYLELGLDPLDPLKSIETKNQKNLNISIRSLKESFLKTGRLDSEYYQEKYEENNEIIKSINYGILNEFVSIKKSIEPGSEFYKDVGIPFVRVSNLSENGLSESDIFLDEKDFCLQYLKSLYPKKDTILFSKDGSVGIAYCVKEDKEIITSGAILHLHIKDKKKILPEYLTLFLNSVFVKLQAERDCGGSIISHWRVDDIKNILIAVLDFKIQEKISKYIEESFSLRKKSKELLDNAKIKVEQEIENLRN